MSATALSGRGLDVLGDPSLLWYVNRAAGFVLLVLLTAATAMGVAAVDRRTRPRPGPPGVRRTRPMGRLPGFVLPELHRRVALVAVALAFLHVVPAVLDDYVPISWLDLLVPFGSAYKSLWLGLGTLAFDLLAVVTVTALLRTRLGPASWKTVHRLAYLAWPLVLAHAVGIGTDAGVGGSAVGNAVVLVCALVVVGAFGLRVRAYRRARRSVRAGQRLQQGNGRRARVQQ